jgi:hypothetical protein
MKIIGCKGLLDMRNRHQLRISLIIQQNVIFLENRYMNHFWGLASNIYFYSPDCM